MLHIDINLGDKGEKKNHCFKTIHGNDIKHFLFYFTKYRRRIVIRLQT